MKENENTMRQATSTPVEQYLQTSNMERDRTWGTEVEIFAFATITKTPVYVYTTCGRRRKWLEYKPLSDNQTTGKAVFIEHDHDHFVPVLDIEGEEYSRPPYRRIGDFVPNSFQVHLSDDLLNAALVNNHRDEELLRQREQVANVYVKTFSNVKYNVDGLASLSRDVDTNIFNIICDWADVENKLN